MQKWEYMLVGSYSSYGRGNGIYYTFPNSEKKKFAGNDKYGEHLNKLLNELGDQGWEIAGVTSVFTHVGIFNTTWNLKRPKNE